MSIEAMTAVWKARVLNKDGKPDAIRKLVLLRFADHANKQGICWPSLPDVAAYSQVSLRQVQREVKTLLDRDDGLLEITRPAVRPGRGRMPMAAVYKIRLDRIAALPQVEEEADGNDSLSQPLMGTTGTANGNDQRVNGNDPVSPQSSVSTTVKDLKTLVPHAPKEIVRTPDGTFQVVPSLLKQWQERFPLVDIPGWLGFIEEYARARPTWAHKRRNWRLTILRWLRVEQERATAKGLTRPGQDETLAQRKEELRRMLRPKEMVGT